MSHVSSNYSVNRTLTRYAGSRRLPRALAVTVKGQANMGLRTAVWLVAVSFCASPGIASSAPPNLHVDDAALIRHIKATDFVFRSTLGVCRNESLQRSNAHGASHFTYKAKCVINPRPEEDCQHYQVTAAGTVDTTTSATVRDIRLKLLCSA